MIKKLIFLIAFSFLITGCSSEPSQLSYEEIKDLSLDEQVDSIIKNTGLVDEYEIIVEDNSIAVIYPTEKVADSNLVLNDRKDSFPNTAMLFIEHLEILELDEIVITSYDPNTSLTRVSALFNKETVKELDFSVWNEEKEEYQQRFYRYSDAYLIRGNVWDKLDDETRTAVNLQKKNSDSQFWDYYGSYVE
ncbi:hypothetical protein [Cytobacillus kochii]|uniref:hypothetical protein n=1 Tax=Cytobacillus kochii TaxID=859143 RepID=UPI0020411F40|nr:hypothetical protein [Cytobacillus kochii]MCM3324277.1 hypothetical protein [Cytobacillus kochii]MCM3346655.1 hypothetical protein [Cytobacillus kochii]